MFLGEAFRRSPHLIDTSVSTVCSPRKSNRLHTTTELKRMLFGLFISRPPYRRLPFRGSSIATRAPRALFMQRRTPNRAHRVG